MRAIHISSLDGPDAVELVDVPEPSDDSLVTIAVKAAGVAFPELLQTRGLYQMKPDLPFVPGAEVAGVVESAPEGSGFAPGDRVAALTLLGGFAEKAQARPDLTFALPDNVAFEEAASFTFNYATVYFALVERGGLAEGESVLVHGAAGGIGTAAIQMAKAFGAGRVIGVVSTEAKGEVARAAGADEVVLADDFLATIGKSSVDVVVDPVGGDRFTDSLRALKEHGRLLVIGFTAGEIPTVKVNRLLLNNVAVVGVGWGAFAMSRPGHVQKEWEAMLPHLRSGALRPVVGSTHALEAAATALTSLEGRTVTGKVVLVP
ncbi:NADPH:quinone oxidoreductase family protein [Janibacter sp. DB-40]|uniref:NADPH:quinone oxidoreductase family protein n=1 Tax=Janibacter sp. DB-40 TaxID=3028808 RepID=UPI00240628EC|nr:NADPH:quinone oxidoreductase family protein [Janibacter sp. DB-40]